MTGDAVVIELPPAGLGTRLLAVVIDVVTNVVVLVLLVLLLLRVVEGSDPAFAATVVVLLSTLVLVIVPAVVETLSRGRSLGKWALGLRVVRDDGGPIRSRQAVARALVGLGEVYLLLGALSAPFVLATERGKRLGDMLAGTYVVNERTALVSSPMAQMPPALQGWAATADIGRIPGPLSLAARSLLGRADSLTPEARDELGGRLVDDLALYVSPPPPAGTSREAFLAAVLAERRERDLVRLRAEQAQVDRLRGLSDRARGA